MASIHQKDSIYILSGNIRLDAYTRATSIAKNKAPRVSQLKIFNIAFSTGLMVKCIMPRTAPKIAADK